MPAPAQLEGSTCGGVARTVRLGGRLALQRRTRTRTSDRARATARSRARARIRARAHTHARAHARTRTRARSRTRARACITSTGGHARTHTHARAHAGKLTPLHPQTSVRRRPRERAYARRCLPPRVGSAATRADSPPHGPCSRGRDFKRGGDRYEFYQTRQGDYSTIHGLLVDGIERAICDQTCYDSCITWLDNLNDLYISFAFRAADLSADARFAILTNTAAFLSCLNHMFSVISCIREGVGVHHQIFLLVRKELKGFFTDKKGAQASRP